MYSMSARSYNWNNASVAKGRAQKQGKGGIARILPKAG